MTFVRLFLRTLAANLLAALVLGVLLACVYMHSASQWQTPPDAHNHVAPIEWGQ